MDAHGFDSMTRKLASGATRRSVLRGGVAAVGAAIGLGKLRGADARRLLPMGYMCVRDSACASGVCGPADATGRRRCGCAKDFDCPNSGPCSFVSCVDGMCVEDFNRLSDLSAAC